jgi:hypothetical protein
LHGWDRASTNAGAHRSPHRPPSSSTTKPNRHYVGIQTQSPIREHRVAIVLFLNSTCLAVFCFSRTSSVEGQRWNNSPYIHADHAVSCGSSTKII